MWRVNEWNIFVFLQFQTLILVILLSSLKCFVFFLSQNKKKLRFNTVQGEKEAEPINRKLFQTTKNKLMFRSPVHMCFLAKKYTKYCSNVVHSNVSILTSFAFNCLKTAASHLPICICQQKAKFPWKAKRITRGLMIYSFTNYYIILLNKKQIINNYFIIMSFFFDFFFLFPIFWLFVSYRLYWGIFSKQ